MILGECFEKFLERSPVSVMVRGTLERVFDPEQLERVFTDHALLQYTRELTFAQCVGLMSGVEPHSCKILPHRSVSAGTS